MLLDGIFTHHCHRWYSFPHCLIVSISSSSRKCFCSSLFPIAQGCWWWTWQLIIISSLSCFLLHAKKFFAHLYISNCAQGCWWWMWQLVIISSSSCFLLLTWMFLVIISILNCSGVLVVNVTHHCHCWYSFPPIRVIFSSSHLNLQLLRCVGGKRDLAREDLCRHLARLYKAHKPVECSQVSFSDRHHCHHWHCRSHHHHHCSIVQGTGWGNFRQKLDLQTRV